MKTKSMILFLLISAFCANSIMAQSQSETNYLASSSTAPEVIAVLGSLFQGDTAVFLIETYNLESPRLKYRVTSDGVWTTIATHRIDNSHVFVASLTIPAEPLSAPTEKIQFRVVCGSEYSEGCITYAKSSQESLDNSIVIDNNFYQYQHDRQ